MSVEKTGDWAKFEAMLAKAGRELQANVQKATDDNGNSLQNTIRQRISSGQVQPPTGEKHRAWKERHGYSNVTLVQTGSLVNAVKYDRKSWKEGFVGVNRNAEGKDGVSLTSLAAVHEYGAPSRNIPARPYIKPAIAKSGPDMVKRYEEAVRKAFK